MSKYSILLLHQFFYPDYVTASVLITQLAEDLAARGMRVDALCGKPREYLAGDAKVPARETHNGVRIRRVGYLQLSRISKLGRLVNYFSFIVSVALRWPGLLRYDLIVVNTTPPLLPLIPSLLHVFFRRKFMFVCYDLYPDLAVAMGAISRGGLIDRVTRFTNRLTYRHAEKVVALGSEMKRRMLAAGLTDDAGKIEVIPNWCDEDPALYAPIGCAESGRTPGAPFTVVYSGNMGVCQDMETIIRCAGLLNGRRSRNGETSPFRFELAGHGAKREGLRRRVEEAGMEGVTFHGFLMGDAYTELLRTADCFLVSLERGMAGLAVPSKTYNYLAAGRPVAALLSPDADIARELSEYCAGAVFANGDAEGLARWLEALAADREKVAEMGANARRLFEARYRRETCTGRYAQLIGSILGAERKGT